MAKKDIAIKTLKLLVTVVDRQKGEFYLDYLSQFEVNLQMLLNPKYGCVNLHVSLLPKYRGAAPMQRAIMNGETHTGVTVMYMDVGLDTGDIRHPSERAWWFSLRRSAMGAG